MSARNSTASTPSSKPDKPAGSPLFWHASGRWCKKIRGAFVYFGRGTHEEALQLYLKQREDLHAGRKPNDLVSGGVTVMDLCNRFLNTKKGLLETGELSMATWRDYFHTCERLFKAFSKGRLVSDLRPEDFEGLRKKWSKAWGPVRLAKEINHVRIVCNYAFKSGLIVRPLVFGEGFKRPSKKVLRLDKKARGVKLFEACEIRAMINGALVVGKDGPELLPAASIPLRAMILLAINAGYGNADCARLPIGVVNLADGWVSYHREKTGIDRRCPLWPETVAALRESLAQRPKPNTSDLKDRVFITSKGESWFKEGTIDEDGKPKNCSDNPISKEMRKLLDRLRIDGSRGFYTIRHTFRTIGGGAKDTEAVRYIMGHAESGIDAHYVEGIADDRLQAVAGYVRRWLFPAADGK